MNNTKRAIFLSYYLYGSSCKKIILLTNVGNIDCFNVKNLHNLVFPFAMSIATLCIINGMVLMTD